MDVYVFRGALYCASCGEHIRRAITARGAAPRNIEDEETFDSDEFPKGPYPEGGGEADSPQHCELCHAFLENPLTGEGREYVRDALREHRETGYGNEAALREWAAFYGIEA